MYVPDCCVLLSSLQTSLQLGPVKPASKVLKTGLAPKPDPKSPSTLGGQSVLSKAGAKGLGRRLPLPGTPERAAHDEALELKAKLRKAQLVEARKADQVSRLAASSQAALTIDELAARYQVRMEPVLSAACAAACKKAVRQPIDLASLASQTADLLRADLKPPAALDILVEAAIGRQLGSLLKPIEKCVNELVDAVNDMDREVKALSKQAIKTDDTQTKSFDKVLSNIGRLKDR